MPSPFPGMNPYLEHPFNWGDFHTTYLVFLRSALAPQVVPKYFVQVQEHVYIHEPDEEDGSLIGLPDASVVALPHAPAMESSGDTVATLPAPAKVKFPRLTRRRVRYLAVMDRQSRQVITVIELLSPSNKRAGDDRDSYLTKRRELLGSGVNFVEIDLLRGGKLPPRDLPPCDYYAIISRPASRPEADIWPIRLRDPLPKIPIPLGPNDREAVVDLQAVLHQAYDGAAYAYSIYHEPPVPPLSPEDAAWAAQFVPSEARRG